MDFFYSRGSKGNNHQQHTPATKQQLIAPKTCCAVKRYALVVAQVVVHDFSYGRNGAVPV